MPEPRFDATTLGEMLLRLSLPAGQRLENATRLDVHPAGAEANVATLLARLGRKTCWTGALPANPLGRLAANTLRLAGVETSAVLWRDDGRLGTYYVEFGEPPRGIQVTYDRLHSCAAQLTSDEIDWATLLDTRILHLSGITPALSPSCFEITQAAIQKAKEHNVPVSFDVNYRQKLWPAQEAAQKLLPMSQGVEILFCSQSDARRLFQCSGSSQEIAQRMLELSHARHVVVTFAEEGALLWNGRAWQQEAARPTRIIDRLGAGDALAAGVIHGWLDGDVSAGLRYGVTLAALALSQFGDMVVTNKSELDSLNRGASTFSR
jgi:2-dehydro-3-deoxygluconokinase